MFHPLKNSIRNHTEVTDSEAFYRNICERLGPSHCQRNKQRQQQQQQNDNPDDAALLFIIISVLYEALCFVNRTFPTIFSRHFLVELILHLNLKQFIMKTISFQNIMEPFPCFHMSLCLLLSFVYIFIYFIM